MEDNTNEIPSERLPFDAEFFKTADEFCQTALIKIPELHGVAIVPLWNVAPENMPAGLLRLRNPQPPYLASLLNLLKKLTAFAVEVHRDMIGQMQMFDNYANELASRIKAQTEQLEQLNQTQHDQPNG